MKFSLYQQLAKRTEKPLDLPGSLQHGMLGIVTEAGEMGDTIKRVVIYGAALDEPVEKDGGKTRRENVREEIGDLLWYIAVIANNLGINLDEAAEENIAKLQKRYPEKYSDTDAMARADKA
jgi:NTP pyrophosphatase (non-canonical NTP hydrolase)